MTPARRAEIESAPRADDCNCVDDIDELLSALKESEERMRQIRDELEAPNHWQKRVEGALALLEETDDAE